jgi:hypothetical protein
MPRCFFGVRALLGLLLVILVGCAPTATTGHKPSTPDSAKATHKQGDTAPSGSESAPHIPGN